jgi:hypothetical protein
MFGTLPGSGSPQEMFISPLENIMSMNSQSAFGSLAPTNPYAHISSANSPVPLSTYSGSPAPSDYSLSLHASHHHAQSQPQRVLDSVQAKSNMAAGEPQGMQSSVSLGGGSGLSDAIQSSEGTYKASTEDGNEFLVRTSFPDDQARACFS